MTEDPYRDIAERYDLFFGKSGEQPEVAAFFGAVFQNHGVDRVLDCACGTGHDLIMFRKLGVDVVGSDVSDSMLQRAQENLNSAGISVPLVKTDYRELSAHFSEPFDAVVCLSSSILHMPNRPETSRALTSMRKVLRAGGLLVITQGTTDRQWREKPRFMLAGTSEDVSRVFVIDYLNGGARYNVLDIEHGKRRGLHVWSVEYPCIFLSDDYRDLLNEAGFREIVMYGGYGFEPYDKESSDRLIIVAGN